MNRRFLLEAITLIVAAALCAAVANAFASRERKLRVVTTVGAPVERVQPEQPPAGGTPPVNPIDPPATATSQPATQPATTTTQPPPQKARTPATTSTSPPVAARPAPRVFAPHPETPWVEIDPAAVRELYDRGAPFVDARRTSVYEQGHIAGARNISVWESDLDDRLKAFYEEGLDPEAPVVVYCSGGNCEDSHLLSQRLWGLGFNNVLVYKDGYPDWLKQGGPTRAGASR